MSDIVADLLRELGPSLVAVGVDIPARNHSDWVGVAPAEPLALVRPRSTEDLATTVRLCAAQAVPVVAQGGLTGLAGGAEPRADWVAISLERMNGIEEIDPATGTMLVKAGTPLEVVQQAASEAGFFYPVDLGARGTATIGGTIATNAGGNRVIRYGMTRQSILGLEVVLADGTIVNALNRFLKNNAGYDIKQLFIGTEGTLGIVTRAVLRLEAEPGFTSAAVCGLPDYPAIVELLKFARRKLGSGLTAFEVMWPSFYDLMTSKVEGVRPPLAGRHGMYVLIESQGTDEAFDAPRFAAFLESAFEEGLIEDAAVARSQGDVQAFWKIRDSVSEFSHVLGPDTALDISLRVAEMDDFVEEANVALRQAFPDMQSVSFGHVGDNNLHLNIHVPGLSKQPKPEIQAIVYELVRRRQGSVSAEHGIGTIKAPFLPYSRNAAEIGLMERLKDALDPKALLNPGKVLIRR
ncbi:FAD/FMN-containing dehydrogenase [Arboricoccus pini]|uniref:FAD/FMN-containing dehydrogenase n=1 Tax=Arboricoccus pini TaxID=1963835 RepID=A0A212QWN3_9PROT|nr:FAD-binding oxidoreductase [Arboricoccus pini]SNB64033.1 FAD/FMN-containing dehydrogenase [Arboricoccus pini]